jgi:hypothetical protein
LQCAQFVLAGAFDRVKKAVVIHSTEFLLNAREVLSRF